MLSVYKYLSINLKCLLTVGCIVTLWSTTAFGQTDLKIGNSPGAITTSAVFEAASTTKGILIPRMTTAQMNGISSPANGLMIYNTTDGCFYVYRTSTWLSTCSPTYAMSWGLLGNASTVDGTNFIGTTDNIPLSMRVNNQKAGRIGIIGETYLGYQAGNAVTSGQNNTYLGYQAGTANTNAWSNAAFGYRALYATTTGGANTAIGDSALVLTTGANNAALGYRAGITNTTGTTNTFLGSTADASSAALSNATALGFGASVNASNKIRLGNSSVTLVETSGSFVTLSDRRLKTNIADNYIGLNFIKAVRPVNYELKSQKGVHYDGFIAQEIDSILQKQGIKDFSGLSRPVNTEGYYTVSYATFVVPLVNAVKELDAKNEATEKENAALKAELARMKAENVTLKVSVDKNTQDIEAIKVALSKKNE